MCGKKMRIVVILMLTFSLYSYYECRAEEYKKDGNVYVPDSMKIVKKADVNVLVPSDGQLQRDSSFFITEPPDAYAARKFTELENYLKELKAEVEAQKEELNRLKETIKTTDQKKDSAPPS